MPSPADEIRAAIAAAPSGAIPFERYMELALYGEHGFYTRPGPGGAGRRRDFLTSPEVGPLFGAVFARVLDGHWEQLGRPDPFVVVDAGAGPGTLARTILAAGPLCRDAMRYLTVEPSASQREAHPDGVTPLASLEEVSQASRAGRAPVGVVIANELLDNLPFALAVFDGAWREAHVTTTDGGATFVEVLSTPFDPVPRALPRVAGHGARAPLQRRAAASVATARDTVSAGSVYVIDYARPSTADAAELDWREWLRTYRRHGRGGHYLASPGEVDITADVMLDQLPPADEVATQADFLARWGIDELVEDGRRAWDAGAAAPTLDVLQMRSRVAESEALLEPSGLGGFTVLRWDI
ncbi:MAG: SAM-dependent methyltransferase [Actinomycetota bacterium]|nr:SAM-dependent methyltransferase [Actinomycetota bacterium]